MNVKEVIRDMDAGRLKPVYLLYGEERYYARQVERALLDAALPPEERDMGLRVFEQEPSVPELVQAVESVPFFGGKNVIIVRDTKLFRSGKGEEGQESTEKADARLLNCLEHIPETTHLLFMAGNKVDKRRKAYKAIEKFGTIVELVPLKARDAREWVQEGLRKAEKSIDPEALDYLMTGISLMTQVSVGFLDNETEKMILHAGGRQRIGLADIEATLAGIPEINIFAMIDAMSQKNIALALKLLDEQLSTGESPIRLLMLMARQVRALLQVKELTAEGRSVQETAKTLGIHPFIAEKMAGQARRFSSEKLKQVLIHIADVDRAIKSGRATNVSLETVIIDMCRG